MVIWTLRPGSSLKSGLSNSARIRRAVSAMAWIWGSTKVILPRNRRLSISSLPPSRNRPGLDLDDLPFLDPEGILERNVGVGAEPRELAELDDRLVGPHALAGVLVPLDDDSVERSDDRVLLEDLLGQRELGLGGGLVFHGFLDLGIGDLELALGLGDVFGRDHARLPFVEPHVAGHDREAATSTAALPFSIAPTLSAWILFLATVSSAASRCR